MITLTHRPATLITVLILAIIAAAHLLRLIFQSNVTVGATEIPVWSSVPALLIAAGLAWWLWNENKR